MSSVEARASHEYPSPGATTETTWHIPVEGMTCAACALRIERKLGRTEGVSAVGVNYAAAEAVVSLEQGGPSVRELVDVIRRTGYDVATSLAEARFEHDRAHVEALWNRARELFADWEAIENGGRVTSKGNLVAGYQAAKVGVPSLMPLSGSRMSSGYGMRDHPVLGRRANHAGIDLAAPTGTPVYATADGRVERASRWSSYGNIVMIEHGGAMETRYAHLSGFAVSEGDKVRKGQLIGYVGSTGRSTGPHLHYEVRVNGQAVNPVPYMNASIDADDSATAGRGGPE